MAHRMCAIHLVDGEEVRARSDPLYDPFTGDRVPIDLCAAHRRTVAGMVSSYRRLLAQFTPDDFDPELVCTECGYPARTRQGLSRHEAAEHPDPDGQRCPICNNPTTNLKTHTWREHPDGTDAEAVDQLAARTRIYDTCDLCESGPFIGAVSYTGHLARSHPEKAPRCPLGCGTFTLTPDRHIRHRHGIQQLRAWIAAGRPGMQRVGE